MDRGSGNPQKPYLAEIHAHLRSAMYDARSGHCSYVLSYKGTMEARPSSAARFGR